MPVAICTQSPRIVSLCVVLKFQYHCIATISRQSVIVCGHRMRLPVWCAPISVLLSVESHRRLQRQGSNWLTECHSYCPFNAYQSIIDSWLSTTTTGSIFKRGAQHHHHSHGKNERVIREQLVNGNECITGRVCVYFLNWVGEF